MIIIIIIIIGSIIIIIIIVIIIMLVIIQLLIDNQNLKLAARPPAGAGLSGGKARQLSLELLAEAIAELRFQLLWRPEQKDKQKKALAFTRA